MAFWDQLCHLRNNDLLPASSGFLYAQFVWTRGKHRAKEVGADYTKAHAESFECHTMLSGVEYPRGTVPRRRIGVIVQGDPSLQGGVFKFQSHAPELYFFL